MLFHRMAMLFRRSRDLFHAAVIALLFPPSSPFHVGHLWQSAGRRRSAWRRSTLETSVDWIPVRRNARASQSVSTINAMTLSSSPPSSDEALDDFDDSWREYEAIMSDICNEKRVRKKCTVLEAEPVRRFLLNKEFALKKKDILNANCFVEKGEGFRADMEKRREAFFEEMDFTKKQKEYMERCFAYVGDQCAKTKHGAPLKVAWLKWRSTGLVPNERGVSTYMYVLGLDKEQEQSDSFSDVLALHGLVFPPNEKTITLRIQLLISQNNPLAAEDLLSSLSNDDPIDSDSKLRTYLPILSHYCDTGNLASALRLFGQMRTSKKVYLDAGSYVLVLSALASRGYFTSQRHIEGQHKVGSELFDDLASQMAEDLLELTEEAASSLSHAFTSLGKHDDEEMKSEKIVELPPGDSLLDQPVIAGRVDIDGRTGKCNATGVQLRLLALDAQQRTHVHDTLVEMAYSAQEEYWEKLKADPNRKIFPDLATPEQCQKEILAFSTWVSDNGKEEPFTAFVDGANVAFFGQGKVQYSQIKLVVDRLEAMGERPLVIMPEKYVSKKFYLRLRRTTQELDATDEETMNSLVDSGKMYVVPSFCFDDYYWMISSVTNQTGLASWGSHTPNKQQTHLNGVRPILVTNDQMRDHRLALLEPRPFRRWTSCHIVNYYIECANSGGAESSSKKLKLFPPKSFSREIQCNTLSYRNVWHFPVTGWAEPSRLCISVS